MKSHPHILHFSAVLSHFWFVYPFPPFSLYKIATSVLMAAISDHHHQPANANPPDHRPARRSSGRRKAKGGEKKVKQPQRGMGVEKLERLRVQEGLKKMAETLPDPVLTTMDGFGSPAYLGFQYGQGHVVTCFSGHCNSCHKKKKFNGGECGFPGLNNTGGHHQKMGGVEVVAVHRKGRGGGSSSGHVMMEYEFFPISRKSDRDSEGMAAMKNSRDDSGFDDVDLSLKL